ncbi:hypothetical protein Anapl_12200 [Anas platyrhynchos]|uniref:Uncharacterized protein n=1 Tax=Anas platyrhynchos TaxID=8839 RepID=R0LNW1_ANAPL|nr:hypothetical protein Anapl_12200 [Anas platyrhynchos]
MEKVGYKMSDEREDVQKKTFTKWINAQFAKRLTLVVAMRAPGRAPRPPCASGQQPEVGKSPAVRKH